MRCRRLAHSLTDRQTAETLLAMAREYDAKAQSLPGLRPAEVGASQLPR